MSEEEHSHELCCGGHDHAPLPESSDPGSKSLTDALRISFRLLAVIMGLMVVGFALTGLQSIESNEVGLVKVFGRITRDAKSGLTYNWPYPIGQIEIVKTDDQTIEVRDFWIDERPGDVEKKLRQRQAQSEGLRPAWDGALLTGDRYLFHMRLSCTYAVTDARAFRKAVRDKYDRAGAPPVDPKEEMVRSAVCSAAIIEAATSTADALKNREKGRDGHVFAKRVMMSANAILAGKGKAGGTGLTIKLITRSGETWPLRALTDYNEVTRARSSAEADLHKARSDAETTLSQTAGQAYVQLVGRPWGTPDEARQRALARKEDRNYDLIGQYSQARDAGDDAGAKAILARIDAVLSSNTVGGQASQIINEATTYANRIEQRAEARLTEYLRLLPEYKRAPELTVQHLWAAVRQEILAAAEEKYYISKGKGRTVLHINRDPEMAKEQQREKFRADKKAREEKAKKRP